MGEWGKWWSSRGRDQTIKCEFCGRSVPKHKAVEISVGMRLSRDLYDVAEYVSIATNKAHCCISCAKHRKIVKEGIHTSEKEKRIKEKARQKREMDKVMVKISEMKKMERSQQTTKTEKPTESKDSKSE